MCFQKCNKRRQIQSDENNQPFPPNQNNQYQDFSSQNNQNIQPSPLVPYNVNNLPRLNYQHNLQQVNEQNLYMPQQYYPQPLYPQPFYQYPLNPQPHNFNPQNLQPPRPQPVNPQPVNPQPVNPQPARPGFFERIRQVPTVKLIGDLLNQRKRKFNAVQNQPQQCCVCLEEFKQGEQVIELNCGKGHIFHPQCIQDWAVQNQTCPLCRADLAELALKEQADRRSLQYQP